MNSDNVRIAVFDHENRRLYIEDVPKDILESYEDVTGYVQDSYYFEGEWSWHYVDEIVYIDSVGNSMDVEIKDARIYP